MLDRYPHTVIVSIKSVVSTNSDGLISSVAADEALREIQGRVELKVGFTKGYKAKFYTDLQDISLFKNDGLHLDFDGREFKIVNWQQRQTHLVLWLD